jgi:hypothetical protein
MQLELFSAQLIDFLILVVGKYYKTPNPQRPRTKEHMKYGSLRISTRASGHRRSGSKKNKKNTTRGWLLGVIIGV